MPFTNSKNASASLHDLRKRYRNTKIYHFDLDRGQPVFMPIEQIVGLDLHTTNPVIATQLDHPVPARSTPARPMNNSAPGPVQILKPSGKAHSSRQLLNRQQLNRQQPRQTDRQQIAAQTTHKQETAVNSASIRRSLIQALSYQEQPEPAQAATAGKYEDNDQAAWIAAQNQIIHDSYERSYPEESERWLNISILESKINPQTLSLQISSRISIPPTTPYFDAAAIKLSKTAGTQTSAAELSCLTPPGKEQETRHGAYLRLKAPQPNRLPQTDSLQELRTNCLEQPAALTDKALIVDRQTRIRAAQTLELSRPMADMLLRDREEEVRLWLARNRSLEPSYLKFLAEDDSQAVRQAVSENPNSKVTTLKLLFKDPTVFVRQVALIIEPLEQSVLTAFASSSSTFVRKFAACCVNAPPNILHLLSHDPNPEVRVRTGYNPSSPSSVLERLSLDNDYHVRVSVALNPNASMHILTGLVEDAHPYVRLSLLRRKTCPLPIINLLSRDHEPVVSQEARLILSNPTGSRKGS